MFGYNFDVNNTQLDDLITNIKNSNSNTHILSFYNKHGVPSQQNFEVVREISKQVDKRYLFKIVNTSGKFWNVQPSYEIYYWLFKNRYLPANVIVDSFYTNQDLKNGSYFVGSKHVQKQIKLIKTLTRLGLICNAGGFGTNEQYSESVFIGIYDDLLKFLNDTGNGLSLYVTTPFPFETYEYFSDNKIFDTEFVINLFNSNQKWSNKHFGEYYGVINIWLNRIYKLGLNIPIYITVNFGFSNVVDYNTSEKFNKIYGNWLNYFKTLFPNEDVSITLYNILNYLNNNILYDKMIKGIYLPFNIQNEFNFGSNELVLFRNQLINR